MSFEKLLADLQTAQTESDDLAKSHAAPEGGAGSGSTAGEGGGEGGAGAGAAGGEGGAGAAGATGATGAAGSEGGQVLVKSFKVQTADGQELEAIDGTEMLKSLEQRVGAGEESMMKAVSGLITLVKGQGALIKSLSDQVKSLGGQGRGRKTVLAITEKAPLIKGGEAGHGVGSGAAEGPTVEEFMLKSEVAWQAGALTGQEYTTIDVACRMGKEIDPGLIKKVLASAAKK